jgi:hypothetical protein
MEVDMQHLGLYSSFVLFLVILFSMASNAQPVPCTNGSVWIVTLIKTKPGMDDKYNQDMAKNWVPGAEALKKDGALLSYKILAGNSANKDDWNVMIMQEYKNWAVLDSIDEKVQAVTKKFIGTTEKQTNIVINRNDLREHVGDKIMQELIFNK